MTNAEVEKLLTKFNDLNDIEVLKYIIKNKAYLTESGMTIQIDNDSVDLIFTKNLNDFNDPYLFTFDDFGYELLDLVFHSIGFKSELV